MILWRLKGCNSCLGDLVLEGDWWRCWQCGRYYRHALLKHVQSSLMEAEPLFAQGHPCAMSNTGCGRRTVRSIDSLVRRRTISDERWWARNRDVITYLDEGRTVREIGLMTGQDHRHVRVVREKLTELRAQFEG